MTPPDRPQGIDREHLELRVDPQPVHFRPRRACTNCGDELFAGDWYDPRTGRCEHCADEVISVRAWLVVAVAVFIAAVAIVAAGWLTAPRPAPDSTAPPPAGDVSRPSTSASGPGLIGAPSLVEVGPIGPDETDGAPQSETVVGPPLEVIRGTATHYCLPGQRGTSHCTRGYGPEDMVAAIDSDLGFSKGDVVVVRYLAGPGRIRVRIVDVCGCPGKRLIDLTSGAFSTLVAGPADGTRRRDQARERALGLGVLPVTVELAGDSSPTLPPTDEED